MNEFLYLKIYSDYFWFHIFMRCQLNYKSNFLGRSLSRKWLVFVNFINFYFLYILNFLAFQTFFFFFFFFFFWVHEILLRSGKYKKFKNIKISRKLFWVNILFARAPVIRKFRKFSLHIFECSFSRNHRILDFISEITAFCLDI